MNTNTHSIPTLPPITARAIIAKIQKKNVNEAKELAAYVLSVSTEATNPLFVSDMLKCLLPAELPRARLDRREFERCKDELFSSNLPSEFKHATVTAAALHAMLSHLCLMFLHEKAGAWTLIVPSLIGAIEAATVGGLIGCPSLVQNYYAAECIILRKIREGGLAPADTFDSLEFARQLLSIESVADVDGTSYIDAQKIADEERSREPLTEVALTYLITDGNTDAALP